MKKILLIVAMIAIQQGNLHSASELPPKDEYISLASIPYAQRTPEQQARFLELDKINSFYQGKAMPLDTESDTESDETASESDSDFESSTDSGDETDSDFESSTDSSTGSDDEKKLGLPYYHPQFPPPPANTVYRSYRYPSSPSTRN